MTEQLPKTEKPENAFDYLLREPRQARRLRHHQRQALLSARLAVISETIAQIRKGWG